MRISINTNQKLGQPQLHYNREYVLNHIKSMNLEEPTLSLLIQGVKDCPDGALSRYYDNINNKIQEIRKNTR